MGIHISRIPHREPPRFGRLAQALMLALVAGSAEAATTWRVDSEAELVQAIASANTHGDTDSIQVRRDIMLHAALPTITQPLSIRGDGGRRTIRRNDSGANACSPTAANPFRLIDATADLTLSSLELSGGCNVTDQGGALRVTGANLRVERSTISGNQTFVDNPSHSYSQNGMGGGLAVMYGSADIVDSTITGNAAHGDLAVGGGLALFYGTEFEIVRSTISGNITTGPAGGGMYVSGNPVTGVSGTFALVDSEVSDNTIAPAYRDPYTGYFYAYGGGVFAGVHRTVTISGSRIIGNHASARTYGPARGGGIAIGNPREIAVDATIDRTLIANNVTDDATRAGGAGVRFGGSGQNHLTITASTIANNVVVSTDLARAGAILIENGHVDVIDSTLSGNSILGALREGGGAVFVTTEYDDDGSLTLVNSTVAGNASPHSHAGGIFFRRQNDESVQPTARIESSVVAGNLGIDGFEEIGTSDDGLGTAPTVIAEHSLLQGAVDVGAGEFLPDEATSMLLGTDPLLQPLADNGGPTPTQALPCGSPAIDQGSNPFHLSFDQRGRGFARKTGRKVDIGAVETRCQH
jgi:hypothetical protein